MIIVKYTSGRKIFSMLFALVIVLSITSRIHALDIGSIESAVRSRLYGDESAQKKLRATLQLLRSLNYKKYDEQYVIENIQQTIKRYKTIPAYVLEKGRFNYIENHNNLIIKGTKVNFRSQPNKQARIIRQLRTNEDIDLDCFLLYYGDWTSPKGEHWILGYDIFSKKATRSPGWVYADFAQVVPNSRFQNLITQIQQSLTQPQKRTSQQQVTRQKSKDSPGWQWIGYIIGAILAMYISDRTVKYIENRGYIVGAKSVAIYLLFVPVLTIIFGFIINIVLAVIFVIIVAGIALYIWDKDFIIEHDYHGNRSAYRRDQNIAAIANELKKRNSNW